MMVITILSVPVSWILARASGDGGDGGDDGDDNDNDGDDEDYNDICILLI